MRKSNNKSRKFADILRVASTWLSMIICSVIVVSIIIYVFAEGSSIKLELNNLGSQRTNDYRSIDEGREI